VYNEKGKAIKVLTNATLPYVDKDVDHADVIYPAIHDLTLAERNVVYCGVDTALKRDDRSP